MIEFGYAIYTVVCWALGALALHTAYRLGSLVEWTVAAIAIGVGGIGFPLLSASSLVTVPVEARAWAVACGLLGLAGASISLYFSTWRVFRPRSMLAPILCTAGTFAIAWSFLAITFTHGYAWPRDPRWIAVQGLALLLPYPWCAIELLAAARRLRRGPGEAEQSLGRSYLWYGIALSAMTLAFIPVVGLAIHRPGEPYPQLILYLLITGGVAVMAGGLGFVGPFQRSLREAP